MFVSCLNEVSSSNESCFQHQEALSTHVARNLSRHLTICKSSREVIYSDQTRLNVGTQLFIYLRSFLGCVFKRLGSMVGRKLALFVLMSLFMVSRLFLLQCLTLSLPQLIASNDNQQSSRANIHLKNLWGRGFRALLLRLAIHISCLSLVLGSEMVIRFITLPSRKSQHLVRRHALTFCCFYLALTYMV